VPTLRNTFVKVCVGRGAKRHDSFALPVVMHSVPAGFIVAKVYSFRRIVILRDNTRN